MKIIFVIKLDKWPNPLGLGRTKDFSFQSGRLGLKNTSQASPFCRCMYILGFYVWNLKPCWLLLKFARPNRCESFGASCYCLCVLFIR